MTDVALTDTYLDYLKQSLEVKPLSPKHYELITPFVDSHNESIAFSIYCDEDAFWLSDDGFTLWEGQFDDAKPLLTKHQQKRFDGILKRYGLVLSDDANQEICSRKVTSTQLGETIQAMIQGLIALDALVVA